MWSDVVWPNVMSKVEKADFQDSSTTVRERDAPSFAKETSRTLDV
jgi:hypothetical protein